MSNKSATLDPRIRGGLEDIIFPNAMLTKAQADYFCADGGVVGYAADRLDDFSDLGDLTANLVRCVHVNPGALYPFECCNVMSPCGSVWRQFFITEYSVCRPHDDISKVRPFTITEFNERFKLGSSVHFIEKNGDHERRVIYTGYCIDNSDVWVSLGPNSYRLDALFDNYKLAIGYVKKDDREEPLWGVFGADSGVYDRVLCSDTLSGGEE